MTTRKAPIEHPEIDIDLVLEEDTPSEGLEKQLLELSEENKALHREIKAQRAETLKVRVDAEQARVTAANEKEKLLGDIEDARAQVFKSKTDAEQLLLSTQSENERLAAELARKSSEITRYVKDTDQTITGLENLDKARLKDIKAKLDTISELKAAAVKATEDWASEKTELRREMEAKDAEISKILIDVEQKRVEAEKEHGDAVEAKADLKNALRDDYSVVGYKRVLRMIAEADVQYVWNGFEMGHAVLNKRGEWLGAAGPAFQSAARQILEDPSQDVSWDLPREAYSK